MKRGRAFAILVPLLTFVIGLCLEWQANSFVAQDVCLDRRGAWDHYERTLPNQVGIDERRAAMANGNALAWR